jgi:hypothetical protein
MKKKIECDICGEDLTELGVMPLKKCRICGLEFCSYCISVHEPECKRKHEPKSI